MDRNNESRCRWTSNCGPRVFLFQKRKGRLTGHAFFKPPKKALRLWNFLLHFSSAVTERTSLGIPILGSAWVLRNPLLSQGKVQFHGYSVLAIVHFVIVQLVAFTVACSSRPDEGGGENKQWLKIAVLTDYVYETDYTQLQSRHRQG